jgi:uncharacterized repeat protein (TIGR03803 family)
MPKSLFHHLAAAAIFCSLVSVMPVRLSAQTYTVLYQFDTKPNDPHTPEGIDSIVQGRDGNLWSSSQYGGTMNDGTVFKVTPSGTLTVVSNLGDPGNDSRSGVTLGTDGYFYGTTVLNGEGPGTAWKVSPAGVETSLHIFGNGSDGACPYAPPIEAADGIFYGTTTTECGFGSQSKVYSLTSTGTLTTLYTFTDGSNVTAPVVQGTDGNFYGASQSGGANGDGEIFKMTPAGAVTVLHSFDGTDGSRASDGLIQASDGNFYGSTFQGGTSSAGVIFKVSPSGTFTVLHNFNGTTDGNGGGNALVQATDGKLYGVTFTGGSSNDGTIFNITTAGAFTVLVNFDGSNGANPNSPLKQNTNGVLYGDTYQGGSANNGVFYSLNMGLKPFVSLVSTSGKVGSKIGILGQGFSASSVVKFNGVTATTVTRTGATFLLATVPAGASNGNVTVTTGATTLTSAQRFIVHNSWGVGAAMPTAVYVPATAVLNGQVYVIGGSTTAPVADVQIYNPVTNKWSTGTPLPVATTTASAAVVNGVLYVLGGSTSTSFTTAVWAYNPATKTWSSKAAAPTARNGTVAVVEKGIVYVMGGNISSGGEFVSTVESYNPATNIWKTESPMLGTKDTAAAGLIGTTVVVADGSNQPGSVTGDTEGYNATTNAWSSLTADPTPRTGPCNGVINGLLYDAGGYNNSSSTTINESFSLSANKWTTTLAPMPSGTLFGGSAVVSGQLYCLGGEAQINNNPITTVQIYQP